MFMTRTLSEKCTLCGQLYEQYEIEDEPDEDCLYFNFIKEFRLGQEYGENPKKCGCGAKLVLEEQKGDSTLAEESLSLAM